MATNRISAPDRLKKNKQKGLFEPTVPQTAEQTNPKSTNNIIPQSAQDSKLKRQTFYIEPNMIKAIGLKAVLEDRDKSEIVRAALEAYVEKKYLEIN